MIFTDVCKKYEDELKDFNYINNKDNLLNLESNGNIKYINKIDNKLRVGGILLKTYSKYNSVYCIIKQYPNKIYYISHSNNYIFYRDNKEKKLNNWLRCFLTDIDNDKYIVSDL